MKKWTLDNHIRVLWFVQGMPPFIQEELYHNSGIDMDWPIETQLDDVFREIDSSCEEREIAARRYV